MAEIIRQRQSYWPPKRITGLNWILSTIVYPITLKGYSQFDRKFWTKNNCNSCGYCTKICTMKNIRLHAGKPEWLHHCGSCMACIQWCPCQAIQYGSWTAERTRYHHPDIQLVEMIYDKKMELVGEDGDEK